MKTMILKTLWLVLCLVMLTVWQIKTIMALLKMWLDK